MSTRRIERLEIEGLFERFNYIIDLGVDKGGLKILTAPNGYGKSTILRMIDAFAKGDYEYFISEKFKSVKFVLSDGCEVGITHKTGGVVVKSMGETVVFDKGKKNIERDIAFDKALLLFEEIGRESFETSREIDCLSKSGIYDYINAIGATKRLSKKSKLLNDLRESLSVISISTNRLKSDDLRVSMRSGERGERKFKVDLLASVVRDEIQQEIRRQFKEGRKLEATFPRRLIDVMIEGGRKPSEDSVMNAIGRIQDYETKFAKLGLVPDTGSSDTINLLKSRSLEGPGLIVLEAYLNDILIKFELLDKLARKLEVFCNSINELLAFKTVGTSADSGIVVRVSDKEDEKVPLKFLSSGEQHLVVLVGELVFKAKESSLVLIDEPEISFHPEWQERFLGILENIQKTNSFSALVSTHSPMLIGDRWDGVVELALQYDRAGD